MVPFAGWAMPVQFEGIIKEHHAVRQAAGIFDVCHMGELEVSGPGAAAALDRIVTNAVRELDVGRALYTVACNERGTILDDLIVYRRAAERFLVVCNASNRDKMVSHFREALRDEAALQDRSDETALVALQGPQAAAILRAAGAAREVTELSSFHLVDADVGGARATIARTGYTGEDGFELFTGVDDAAPLFRALLEAGEAHGLKPAGLGARDTLRLEARLSLYGNEIDESTHPYEAGLGWVVKLDKGDFIGRDALQQIKADGWERKLVGFEMTGRGIGRHGYPILDAAGTQEIGVVTSGAPSPTLGKNIGLGYVPKTHADVGTALQIRIRSKLVEAQVVRLPFYKRPD